MPKTVRDYIMPDAYAKVVRWKNGTPHLTQLAVNVHESRLDKTVRSRSDLSDRVAAWLVKSGVKGSDEAISKYRQWGPAKTFEHLVFISPEARSASRFISNMLKDEVDKWKQEPTLANTSYLDVLKKLNNIVKGIEHPGLKKFESKNLLKYGSNASKRNFQAYINQVQTNYDASRPRYRNKTLPDMECYDIALKAQYAMFSNDLTEQQLEDRLFDQMDFISKTRDDTSGGAPYYHNMGDYTTGDVTNKETWSDRYNTLALLWLMLPPHYKELVYKYYTYMALERVQTGGLEEFTGEEMSEEALKQKANKQRFVQAESAIFTKALKAIHDVMLSLWRNYKYLSADKWSEEWTTETMITIAHKSAELASMVKDVRTQGADWSNYDADIESPSLNDSYFNAIRMNMPKWVNSYIVDPYFKVAFRTRIFVPGVGLILSTGIKSGMLITNQGDCFHANFIDLYEISRWVKKNGGDVENVTRAAKYVSALSYDQR